MVCLLLITCQWSVTFCLLLLSTVNTVAISYLKNAGLSSFSAVNLKSYFWTNNLFCTSHLRTFHIDCTAASQIETLLPKVHLVCNTLSHCHAAFMRYNVVIIMLSYIMYYVYNVANLPIFKIFSAVHFMPLHFARVLLKDKLAASCHLLDQRKQRGRACPGDLKYIVWASLAVTFTVYTISVTYDHWASITIPVLLLLDCTVVQRSIAMSHTFPYHIAILPYCHIAIFPYFHIAILPYCHIA